MGLTRGLDLHQQLPRRHLVARLDRQARDGAVAARGHFVLHLHGLDDHQPLPLGDGIACLDKHGHDLAVHRCAQLGLGAACTPGARARFIQRLAHHQVDRAAFEMQPAAGKRVGSASLLPVHAEPHGAIALVCRTDLQGAALDLDPVTMRATHGHRARDCLAAGFQLQRPADRAA